MGQGDFKEEEFSDEEKAALGEAEETAPDAEKDEQEAGPDTQDEKQGVGDEQSPDPVDTAKTEPTEQEKEQQAQAEELGLEIVTDEKTGKQYVVDEDGARIPPKRFSEIYRQAKEGERTQEKLNLFKKLGPEGYYQAFPDERPAQPAPVRQPTPIIPPGADIGSLKVVQPGGQYDGMTLREVYDVDPVFATNLQNDFLWNQKVAVAQQQAAYQATERQSQQELMDFGAAVGKAAFNKEAKDLNKKELADVGETIAQVIRWMNQTGRGGGNLYDAYFLMNQEGLFKKVAESTAQKTIKNLTQRKGPASIDTSGGGDGKGNGFDALEKMNEAQLTAKIDAMTDKEMAAFFKSAPKSLRTKHPSLPWG